MFHLLKHAYTTTAGFSLYWICNYHSSVAESSPQNSFSILINNDMYYISIGLSWYMTFQKEKTKKMFNITGQS